MAKPPEDAEPDLRPQPDKFRDLARQLGGNEDEKAFEEKVKLAAGSPAESTKDGPQRGK